MMGAAGAAAAGPVGAQTPPGSAPRADDTPSVRVGATLFADYTVTAQPKGTDADGNAFTPNAFNVGRAYINVTGNVSRLLAFRVTPDIVRESGTASSASGSLIFRLKYAFAQVNLDDWLPRGSFARFGMQQTPWVDFLDSVYRYRFQGPTFEDREGILSSSDVGASVRYVFDGNYGDVHGGFYNGETYSRPEANEQKAFMVRGTVRPLPARERLRGLRVTGFYDRDAYVRDAERRRAILGATYEHPYVNTGGHYLGTSDRTLSAGPKLDGQGYSVWATPKTPKGHGWEGLLRYDHLRQDQATAATAAERNRTIAGVAYWFPQQGSVSAAILLDYERVDNSGYVPSRADERRWAVHTLINF
jgi:hypothetical protein